MEEASLELQVSKMMTTEVESVERGEVRRQNRERNIHIWEKNLKEMLAKESCKEVKKDRRGMGRVMC